MGSTLRLFALPGRGVMPWASKSVIPAVPQGGDGCFDFVITAFRTVITKATFFAEIRSQGNKTV